MRPGFAYLSQTANVITVYRDGEGSATFWCGIHLFSTVVLTVVFHFGLKIRATIGRLPDKELETFLVDTLFKGGIGALFSILFLTFRTTKCAFEEGGLEKCEQSSWCAMCISIYLLIWFLKKIADGGVKSEWKKSLVLSIEKITTMRDISLRRGVAGFLTLVTGVCAIFLFSMMSANEKDEMTYIVGLIGQGASFGVIISEIYSSLKAQERRIELSESGALEEQQQALEPEEPVEECSWIFSGISFLLTSVYSALPVLFGVTMENQYKVMSTVVLPISVISWLLSFVSKPKRTDTFYKCFLYFHHFSFLIPSEIGYSIGHFREGDVFRGIFAMCRLFGWVLLFRALLTVREAVSKVRTNINAKLNSDLSLNVLTYVNCSFHRRHCLTFCATRSWSGALRQLAPWSFSRWRRWHAS